MPENDNVIQYPDEPSNPSGYTGFNKSVYYIFSLLRDMYYSKVESENKFYTKNGGTITGSVTIQGNLIVNGQSYYIDTENLKVGDYTITLAKDNENSLTSMVGMVVPKYDGTNYGFFGWDADGYAYVGDLTNWDGSSAITLANNSSLQKISTIDTTNTVVASNGVIYVYDATSHCFKKPTNDNKYYVIRNGAFVETELFDTQAKKNINNALYNLGAYDSVSGNTITRGGLRKNGSDIEASNIHINDDTFKVFYIDGSVFPNIDESDSSNIIINTLGSNGLESTPVNSTYHVVYLNFNVTKTFDEVVQIVKNSIFQYKLSSSYQEQVIENTSLLNLDQAGCDFVRDEYEKSSNLFNKATVGIGTIVAGTGANDSDTDYRHSDFIEVEPNTTYKNNIEPFSFVSSGLAFYDSSKTYISGIVYQNTNYQTFTTPSNAKYVRFTIGTNYNTVMLNKGNYAMPYQEYCGDIVHKADIEPVLLWENSSPNSAFAGQDINISNTSNFKYLVLEMKRTSSSNHCGEFTKVRNEIGKSAFTIFADDGTSSMNITSRSVYIQSTTQVHFYDGIVNNAPDNDVNIPIAIYGTNVL